MNINHKEILAIEGLMRIANGTYKTDPITCRASLEKISEILEDVQLKNYNWKIESVKYAYRKRRTN